MSTAVTLERCAEVRAEMTAGRLQDDVLARAGLGADEWTVAQREWLDKMGAELERGRFELTNRYTQAFLEHLKAFTAPPAPEPATAELPAVALPPMALPPMALPPMAPPPVALPPIAPPPVALPPIAPPPARPAAVPVPRSPLLAGTVVGAISPFATKSLPFRPAAPGAGPPAARPPAPPAGDTAPRPPSTAGDETGMPAASPLRSALPFQPAAAPARPDTGTAEIPALAAPSPPKAPEPAEPARGALPKPVPPPAKPLPPPAKPPPPPGAKPPPPPAAKPLPPPAKPPPPPAAKASTAPAQVPAPPPSSPTAASPPPLTLGGLTLEQHASLCAEMMFDPPRAAEAIARYRVTAEKKAEMDAAWKERFVTDKAAHDQWQKAYRYYFAYISAKRT